MRRKPGVVAAAALFLSLIVLLLGFWRNTSSSHWSAPRDDPDIIGSPFISKGKDAGDKVIVIATMATDNAGWVADSLPE